MEFDAEAKIFHLEALAQVAHDTYFAHEYKDASEVEKALWRNVVLSVAARMYELNLLTAVYRPSSESKRDFVGSIFPVSYDGSDDE